MTIYNLRYIYRAYQRVVFVCVCVDGPELFASTNLPFKETDEKK